MKLPTTYLAGKIFLMLIALFGVVGVAQGRGLFDRNLRPGDRGEDVRQLQVFLNTHGTPIAKTGVGSLGQETTIYGEKTRKAVVAFQQLHRAQILTPAKLVRGTGNFSTITRQVANELMVSGNALQGSASKATPGATSIPVAASEHHQPTYTVGGTATGLVQPVLLREASGETIHVKPGDAANFVFSHPFVSGERYEVSVVSTLPSLQRCYVSSNGVGIIANTSVLNVQVQCTLDPLGDPFRSFAGHGTESYSLGGTVSGLSGTLVLQTAQGDSATLTSNGSFTFGSRIPRGSVYNVSVRTNPSSPDQTCTVTNGSGTLSGQAVTNIEVACETNATTLSASVSNLALSIAGLVGPPSSGQARSITITNTGGSMARGLSILYPTFPSGTVASGTTCSGTLAPGASCTITITPGSTPSSDGSGPCSLGTAPIPGAVQVTADNANTVSTNVLVLSYGCIYQEGYLFAIDDDTPPVASIGGKVAALTDQSDGIVWGSNGVDSHSVSYDLIPGIGETSTYVAGTPTFGDFSSFFGGTYAGVLGLTSGNFAACNGATDGWCNTANIVTFYNQYQTNYGVGSAPYTPVAAPTPKAYYAAGVCDDYNSGTYQDWYLPAICEFAYDEPLIRPELAGCGVEASPLMQTVLKNLYLNGVGGITMGAGFWSSSAFMYASPETYTWNTFVWAPSFPGGGDKSDLAKVRCVRSVVTGGPI